MELNFKCDDILNAKFNLYKDNPIIKHFGLSPVVADPSVLTPAESPDEKWHLFCHTLFGICHTVSKDGIAFSKPEKIVKNAMRPDIKVIDGTYYLYYEKTQRLPTKGLTYLGLMWKSDIEVITSKDTVSWSKPKKVLLCDKAFEKYKGGSSLSNPFLFIEEDAYRLYYSCGLTYIKDCGFSEPTYIACADSDKPNGGFVKRDAPIISPDINSDYLNLCCGCLKVYKLTDGYIGLQNGIYFDKAENKSKSAIMLLFSKDGIRFEHKKVLLAPSVCGGNNWMAQYVYACCLTYFDGKLYLYFNARDVAAALKGRESIGVAIANL